MFHLHQQLQYFLYPEPVDMRKSFYTLSGIVSGQMRRKVESGEVFIFVNRNLTVMKILHMEYGGMVIYHKKLESGRFKLPEYDQALGSFTVGWVDLMMMVKSVKMRPKRIRKIAEKVENTDVLV